MSGLGFIEPMTSSNTFKKLVSIGAAMLLAVGGSLTSATSASAAAATSAPVINGTVFAGVQTSVTPAVWPSGTPSGRWFICPNGGSTAAATSIPAGCEALQISANDTSAYTSTSPIVPSIAYCAISCTSFGNSSLGSYLRYIEQNLTDISASAAVLIREAKPLVLDAPAVGQTFVSLSVSGGCTFASPSMPTSSDWSVTVAGTTASISNIATANNKITLSIGSSLTAGQAISVAYQRVNSSLITCGVIAAVPDLGSPLTATVAGGGGGGGQTVCAGQTGITSYTASASTISPGGSFTQVYNGNPSLVGCSLPVNGFASARFINGNLIGTFYFGSMSQSLYISSIFPFTYTQLQTQAGRPLVDGDVYTSKIWVNPGSTQPSQSSAGDFSFSVTVTNAGLSNSAPALTAEQARNTLKPVPAAVQPLVPAFLALNKPMASLGGKVALSAGDFTGLVSAKIAGKSLDFILGNTGKITMTVPQGEAGKTADLVLTFGTGSIILQDAIKYVAPLDIAKVGVRPISIAAGAKKISDGVADQIRQAAFANLKNDTIQCIAYSANNSSAATAAAKLTAVQACAVAVKANPDLKVADVAVIVDKLKARTQGVGIKVYKATN